MRFFRRLKQQTRPRTHVARHEGCSDAFLLAPAAPSGANVQQHPDMPGRIKATAGRAVHRTPPRCGASSCGGCSETARRVWSVPSPWPQGVQPVAAHSQRTVVEVTLHTHAASVKRPSDVQLSPNWCRAEYKRPMSALHATRQTKVHYLARWVTS